MAIWLDTNSVFMSRILFDSVWRRQARKIIDEFIAHRIDVLGLRSISNEVTIGSSAVVEDFIRKIIAERSDRT